MKIKLSQIAIFAVLLLLSQNLFAVICMEQLIEEIGITGGTRYIYHPVPCGQTAPGGGQCPCTAYDTPWYECICNTGYSVTNQNTSNCSCVANPKCATGYYGNGITCTRCPVGAKNTSGSDVYGTTGTTNVSINDCYLAIGTYQDNNGIYDITSKCSY